MAVEIGALRALLSLDSAAFERGARRAQASMGNLQRRLAQTASRFRQFGRTMSMAVTGPVVAASGLLVRSSLQTIDAQAKMAESMGTTTASLQVLARAAETAGVSQGDLDGSLRRMTRRISLAAQGAGAGAQAFERLGLTFEDLQGLDAAERVSLITDRINEMVPAAERAGVASQVFGDKTGLAMLRLRPEVIASAAAELDRFGVTVSEIEADGIEATNDALSSLGLAASGLGNQLATALAPTLQAIADRLADVAKWFNNLSPRMKRFAAGMAALAAAVGPALLALGAIVSVMAALNPLVLAAAGLATAAGAAYLLMAEKTNGVESALLAAEAGQVALNTAMGTFYETAAPASASAAINAANANYQLAQSALAAAEAEVAKLDALVQYRAGKSSGQVRGAAGLVTEADEAEARERLDRARAAVERAQLERDRAARAVTGSMSVDIEAAAEEVRGLELSLDGATEALEGVGGSAGRAAGPSGIGAVADALSEIDTEIEPIADNIKQKFDSVADSIGNAMAGAIVDGKDFGQQMAMVFQQIARDLISSGISNMISSIFSGVGGVGGGGLFGSIGRLFGGGRASGGPVSPGKFYTVGERGPELLVPGASGMVVPNSARLAPAQAGPMNIILEDATGRGISARRMPDRSVNGQRSPVFELADAVGEAMALRPGGAHRYLARQGVRETGPKR